MPPISVTISKAFCLCEGGRERQRRNPVYCVRSDLVAGPAAIRAMGMTVLDDVALLGEITAFAAEVFAKPTGTDSAERREHLAFLAQKLDETAASTAYRHIVCRFAPALIKATEGA